MLVVHGAVGSGKTRLASELERRPDVIGSLRAAFVRCRPGDRAVAVRARAERSLDALPGSLSQTLEHEPFLLIIDDVHHLPEDDAARMLAELATEPGIGRVLVLTRDVLPLRRDRRRFEMNLDGLDEAAARELWVHHEETYGPTPAGAVDDALARTRGMPLALRREYARAAFGADAWKLSKLPADVRRALEAVAVVRLPAAPAAIAAMLPKLAPEPALIELVSRQLIDPIDSGRFSIHDVVRDEVLQGLAPAERTRLERAAAELVSTVGRGRGDARRMAWDAGDDGALGLVDPVDRMREAVLHLIEADDLGDAAARLVEDRGVATRRGGGGEILALIETLEARRPALSVRLAPLRADIAARHGRVAEALELADALAPIEVARLAFAAGDIEQAVAVLAALTAAEDPELRCRAAAALAEIELLRGDRARAEHLAAEAFERDRAAVGDEVRAILHLAMAAIEQHAGRITAARAALSRAASSGGLDPSIAALIEARRAHCLAIEGRLTEAEKALLEAEQSAREVDAVAVADEIRRISAIVRARRGELSRASAILEQLVVRRRQRGDEVGALCAELDLSAVLTRRGELAAASELATACRSTASRRKLAALEGRAIAACAAIDLAELRVDDASAALTKLCADERGTLSADIRAEATALLAQARAWVGAAAPATSESTDLLDEIDAGMATMLTALAAGDSGAALDAANGVAVRAERAGRSAEVADALALVARLQLARGDRAAAGAAATRAAR
ncbi:MAG TPA: ATP-binding protein, partial [Kofleriaceae bacterium]|nr:ATP-binding protein [Kofleriaceae bacterium]